MAVRNRVLVLDPLREYDFLLRLVQLLRLAQEMAISGAIVPPVSVVIVPYRWLVFHSYENLPSLPSPHSPPSIRITPKKFISLWPTFRSAIRRYDSIFRRYDSIF